MIYENTPRFGNISTADLIERAWEDRIALEELQNTIRARLIAESGIIVGRVYRVANDDRPLAGRLIWVEGVNAGLCRSIRRERFYCFAWGRMNGKSAAGDGWTIKRQNVTASRLTLEPAHG